jgi:hypothetical protein
MQGLHSRAMKLVGTTTGFCSHLESLSVKILTEGCFQSLRTKNATFAVTRRRTVKSLEAVVATVIGAALLVWVSLVWSKGSDKRATVK